MDYHVPANRVSELNIRNTNSCNGNYVNTLRVNLNNQRGSQESRQGVNGRKEGRHRVLTIALFSLMFKALFSKNAEPFSSESESESRAGISFSGTVSISAFLLSDLRGGNFIATFRGAGYFCAL